MDGCHSAQQGIGSKRFRFSCLTKSRDIVINYLLLDVFLSHTIQPSDRIKPLFLT
jgi:hypothetical protein